MKTPVRKKSATQCNVLGCTEASRQAGVCSAHYDAGYRLACSFEGCAAQALVRTGFCVKHEPEVSLERA